MVPTKRHALIPMWHDNRHVRADSAHTNDFVQHALVWVYVFQAMGRINFVNFVVGIWQMGNPLADALQVAPYNVLATANVDIRKTRSRVLSAA